MILFLQGQGGSTTTAQTAGVFFASEVLMRRLASLVPVDSQEVVMELGNRLYTILRLISCDYSVVTEQVAALCTETQLLCIDRIGDWIKFSPTIHELLAHSATCMEAVGSRGLLFVTEESLESSNKVLNKTRERKAWLFGAEVQHSTFFHLIVWLEFSLVWMSFVWCG